MTLLHSMSHKITAFWSVLVAITQCHDVRTLKRAVSPKSIQGALHDGGGAENAGVENAGVENAGVDSRG